jgi:hypothetical protein
MTVPILLDGPAAGRQLPPDPVGLTPPTSCCVKPDGQDWAHYVHVGDHQYEHAGSCRGIDHQGLSPWREEPCCCGRKGCDGSGPWPDNK